MRSEKSLNCNPRFWRVKHPFITRLQYITAISHFFYIGAFYKKKFYLLLRPVPYVISDSQQLDTVNIAFVNNIVKINHDGSD